MVGPEWAGWGSARPAPILGCDGRDRDEDIPAVAGAPGAQDCQEFRVRAVSCRTDGGTLWRSATPAVQQARAALHDGARRRALLVRDAQQQFTGCTPLVAGVAFSYDARHLPNPITQRAQQGTKTTRR